MKIARFVPVPQSPPPMFEMTFTRGEGWALVMALRDAYAKYPRAADRHEWKAWADDLDKKMRA